MSAQDHVTEGQAAAESLNKCQSALEEAEEAGPRTDRLLPMSLQAQEQLSAYLSDAVDDSPDTVKGLVEVDRGLRELASTTADSESNDATSINILRSSRY